MAGSEEFVLIPNSLYKRLLGGNENKEQLDKEEILNNPKIKAKSKIIPTIEREPDKPKQSKSYDPLANLTLLSGIALDRARRILAIIEESPRVSVSEDNILLDGNSVDIRASSFLQDLQNPKKRLPASYQGLVSVLHLPNHLVKNKYAKQEGTGGWIDLRI